VYCCLPLHHPSGTLVSAGSALVGGARLALATKFEPTTFWDEVRRYGVSVVFYAGEMPRALVDAQPVLGEKNNPVRLFAGSGLRKDAWRRLIDRFGPVGVLEMYASSEANTVLANARGKKIGSVGRPLPGSPDTIVAGWNVAVNDFERTGDGRLQRARLDEPGMLIAKMSATSSDVAHIDPKRIIRDAFETGDQWFVTGEIATVDTEGDFWLVDRASQMIPTRMGPIASTRIEDALYEVPNIALCFAVPHETDAVAAVIQLRANATLDLAALSTVVATLPEYARPRLVMRSDEPLPMTDGFRLIKTAHIAIAATYAWDPLTQRFGATESPSRSSREAAR
jgi:putative long chain acyl-CoA synthase